MSNGIANRFLCAMTMCLSLVFSLAQDEELPITVGEVLEKCEATRRRVETRIIRWEESRRIIEDGKPGERHHYAVFEERTDGTRCDTVGYSWFELAGPDAPKAYDDAQHRREMWDGTTYYAWAFDEKETDVRAFVRMRRQGQKYPHYGISGGFQVLDGNLGGDRKPLSVVLRESDDVHLRPKREPVKGSLCYVIEATRKDGRYKVWFDPDHGYNIARAEVVRSEKELEFQAAALGLKAAMHKAFSQYLRDVVFREIDGVWVPVEGVDVCKEEAKNGLVFEMTRRTKRTHIDLTPDFEAVGAFVPPAFEDGTRVRISGDPGVEYEWRDGNVVPRKDD